MISPTKLNRSLSHQSGHPRGHSTPQTPGGVMGPPSASTPTRGGGGSGFLTPSAGPLRTPSDKPSGAAGPPTTGLFSSGKKTHAQTPKFGTPVSSRLGPGATTSGTPFHSFSGTPGGNQSIREDVLNASRCVAIS